MLGWPLVTAVTWINCMRRLDVILFTPNRQRQAAAGTLLGGVFTGGRAGRPQSGKSDGPHCNPFRRGLFLNRAASATLYCPLSLPSAASAPPLRSVRQEAPRSTLRAGFLTRLWRSLGTAGGAATTIWKLTSAKDRQICVEGHLGWPPPGGP